MSRPVLTICTKCDKKHDGGEELYERVRAVRKERGLKEVFKVDEVRCLGLCDNPCALMLEGKKRSTYLRTGLAPGDAERIVEMAVAYAALEPGQEISERDLPGDHAD